VTENELMTLMGQYKTAFNVSAPLPMGISDDRLGSELKKAIESGKPIDDDFDWWTGLPDGAVA
jgi:hypothetical protein